MTILDEIVEHKKREIQERRQQNSTKNLEKSKYFERDTLPLTDFLLNPEKTGIVAEFKKQSPSKGIINNNADAGNITTGYAAAGASGLSVLTDAKYFGGSNQDLVAARELNTIPILRKDFMISEYQVIEAKSIGADVILLIAASLTVRQAKELARLADSLKMQVILEVYNIRELACLNEYIDIVGVNNRNLRDFSVDINVSVSLSQEIAADFVKISESGIDTPAAIRKLREYGYQGFLIGEKFMVHDDPVAEFKKFVQEL
jgi:indole-3-glycerol phosphate synthase